MELNVKTESLRNAIGTVMKVSGTTMATLEVKKTGVFVSGSQNNRSARIRVDADVINTDHGKTFGFNCQSVLTLLKGRGDVLISYDEPNINFRSKNKGSTFTASLNSNPPEKVEIAKEEGSRNIQLPTKALAVLNTNLNALYLTNLYAANEAAASMLLCVRLNSKGLVMTVFDDHHMAFAHDSSTVEEKELSFSVPIDLYALINTIADGRDYKLSIGNAYISALADDFELSIPIMQSSVARTVEQAESLIDRVVFDTDKVSFVRSDLLEVMNNLNALNDGTITLDISCKKDNYVELSTTSARGQAKDKRKIRGTRAWKNTYKVNPELLNDCVEAFSGQEILMHFNKNILIMVHEQGSTRFTYLCMLM